jgi:hypothetical protein
MKAALALIILYIAMFLVAIHSGSSVSVQAAPQTQGTRPAAASNIDPAKEADIRALLELVGARDQVQDSVTQIAEQYREKLLATVPHSDKGQQFVNTTISEYEKRYDVNRVNEQLVVLYDRHYSDDEIKGLLQFFGSPLGQKVAAESPKIFREIQEATRAEASKAVKDALQEAKQQNPGVGQNAHLVNGPRRPIEPRRGANQPDASQQSAQQEDPQ